MRIYELTPKNGRKSFYRKAYVIIDGKTAYLRSYETIIGSVDPEGNAHRYSDHHSCTTGAHVKSFLDRTNHDAKAFWELPIERAPRLTINI